MPTKQFSRALSVRVIFHPIIRLFKTGTTVVYPHQVQLGFLTIAFAKKSNLHGKASAVVYASHRWSDDGLVCIQLAINTFRSDHVALHVRFHDAVANEPIKIISYSLPASSQDTTVMPIGTLSELPQPAGHVFTYGMRDNVVQWDWQHKPGDECVSECHFGEVSIRAVRLVKAEFRFISRFQNDGEVETRSIPHGEGKFVKRFLRLDD